MTLWKEEFDGLLTRKFTVRIYEILRDSAICCTRSSTHTSTTYTLLRRFRKLSYTFANSRTTSWHPLVTRQRVRLRIPFLLVTVVSFCFDMLKADELNEDELAKMISKLEAPGGDSPESMRAVLDRAIELGEFFHSSFFGTSSFSIVVLQQNTVPLIRKRVVSGASSL